MRKNKKLFITSLLMLLTLFLFTSCTKDDTPQKELLERALKLPLPRYTVSKYVDTHKGYDGETYVVLKFDDMTASSFYHTLTSSGAWKGLPINTIPYANVTWAGILTPQAIVGQIPSNIENGIWYFCDRSDRLYTYADRRFTQPSTYENQTVIEAKICKNFTLCVYDIDQAVLYIYIYDKMPISN